MFAQYLEDHPESVLDASFLSGLHEMACQLVQESFHFDETHDQVLLRIIITSDILKLSSERKKAIQINTLDKFAMVHLHCIPSLFSI